MNFFNELREQLIQLVELQPNGYQTVQQTCSQVSLLLWLKAQHQSVKMYWGDKENSFEVAMLGICHQVFDLADDTRISQARYFGGIGFDTKTSNWQDYGYTRFVLPRLALRKSGNNYDIICHLDCRSNSVKSEVQACLNLLDSLQEPAPLCHHRHNTLLFREDIPDQPLWHELITKTLQAEQQGTFSKVVLSRETSLCFEQEIDEWELLYHWKALNSNCYQFAFQYSNDKIFMGCSPERLYLRSGSRFTSESLAGTTLHSHCEQEDENLTNALLLDPKLRSENTIVHNDILSRLSKLCLDIGVDDVEVLKLNRIQHLKQRIHAFLHDHVNDETLLNELHPTPAVGGSPRDIAMDFILTNEPYKRGWYAGAVGYVSADQSEFSVGIRSALISKNNVKLYAGAGIVLGSESTLEWQELDNKISTVLALLTEQ